MAQDGIHVFFDFDSTVVRRESLDMVIESALELSPEHDRLVAEVAAITNAGMEGTLSFTRSLEARFAVVPLTRVQFADVGRQLLRYITPGMLELFSELTVAGVTTYIISGGFRDSILPVAFELGVPASHVYTNDIIVDEEGKVTGVDTDNICYTDDGKAPVVAHIKKVDQITGPTVMVGDGANDLRAYERGEVDLFIGFTQNVERAVVREKAPALAGSVSELRELLLRK